MCVCVWCVSPESLFSIWRTHSTVPQHGQALLGVFFAYGMECCLTGCTTGACVCVRVIERRRVARIHCLSLSLCVCVCVCAECRCVGARRVFPQQRRHVDLHRLRMCHPRPHIWYGHQAKRHSTQHSLPLPAPCVCVSVRRSFAAWPHCVGQRSVQHRCCGAAHAAKGQTQTR